MDRKIDRQIDRQLGKYKDKKVYGKDSIDSIYRCVNLK